MCTVLVGRLRVPAVAHDAALRIARRLAQLDDLLQHLRAGFADRLDSLVAGQAAARRCRRRLRSGAWSNTGEHRQQQDDNHDRGAFVPSPATTISFRRQSLTFRTKPHGTDHPHRWPPIAREDSKRGRSRDLKGMNVSSKPIPRKMIPSTNAK